MLLRINPLFHQRNIEITIQWKKIVKSFPKQSQTAADLREDTAQPFNPLAYYFFFVN
jgi:hypothetical protein